MNNTDPTPPAVPDPWTHVEAVLTWLRIRSENGLTWPEDVHSLRIDAQHSALLQRLLRGLPPQPVPPPLAHASPWHALIDDGFGQALEVWPHSPWMQETLIKHYGVLVVIVDQHPWRMLRRLSPLEWLIQPFQGRSKMLGPGIWRATAKGEPGSHPWWELRRESEVAGLEGSEPTQITLQTEDGFVLPFVGRVDQVKAWLHGETCALDLMSHPYRDTSDDYRALRELVKMGADVTITVAKVPTHVPISKVQCRAFGMGGAVFRLGTNQVQRSYTIVESEPST